MQYFLSLVLRIIICSVLYNNESDKKVTTKIVLPISFVPMTNYLL